MNALVIYINKTFIREKYYKIVAKIERQKNYVWVLFKFIFQKYDKL